MINIASEAFKKYRLTTQLNSLDGYSANPTVLLQQLCGKGDSVDVKELKKTILKIFKVNINIFKKMGLVLNLSSINSWNGANSYRGVDGAMEYDSLFRVSFEYAALKYLLRLCKNPAAIDAATATLIYRSNFFIGNRQTSIRNCDDFKTHKDTALERLAGTHIESSLYDAIGQGTEYMYYLLLPQMDSQVVQDHKDIFNALKECDHAAFEAILNA